MLQVHRLAEAPVTSIHIAWRSGSATRQEARDLVVGGAGHVEPPLAGGLVVDAHRPRSMLLAWLVLLLLPTATYRRPIPSPPPARSAPRSWWRPRAAARLDGRRPVDARPCRPEAAAGDRGACGGQSARRGGGRRRPGRQRGRARCRAAGARQPAGGRRGCWTKAAMRGARSRSPERRFEHRTVGPERHVAVVAAEVGFLRRKAAVAVGEPWRDPGG